MSKGKELLKNLKFYDSYSKYKEEEHRKETWEESVVDVMSLHYNKFSENEALKPFLDKATEMYKDGRILASQRSLQYREKQILSHNARLFNCASTYIDRPDVFKQVLYVLLCGCGMGYSVEKRFVDKLPLIQQRQNDTITHVIEDSIEGWAVALDMLMASFFNGTEQVRFDGSNIRPEGAFISGGFKAPGYEPLKKSLEQVEKILQDKIKAEDFKLTSLDCHEIICITSDAVLSAGVRRSALICLFDKDDSLMLNCKTGDWFYKKPHLARANNTVKLILGDFTKEEFDNLKTSIKEFGEPGVAIVRDVDFTTNPCFPIDQRILTENGWESFEDLLGTNPIIHQDLRIKGEFGSDGEIFKLTNEKGGKTVLTQGYNVSKTGEQKQIYKLTTTCGREVRATGDHDFGTKNGMVKLENLKLNDEILIGVPETAIVDSSSYDYKLGMLMGLCAGDGVLTNKTVLLDIWESIGQEHSLIENIVSEVIVMSDYVVNNKGGKNISLQPKFNLVETTEKYVKYRLDSAALRQIFTKEGFLSKKESYDWLFSKSKNIKAGFLSGLFLADGHIEASVSKNTMSCRITQSGVDSLRIWQLIAQELGLFGKIYKLLNEKLTLLPDGHGFSKEYLTKSTNRLVFSGRDVLERFSKVIYLIGEKKLYFDFNIKNIYNTDKVYTPSYSTKISKIGLDGVEDVYCLKEDENRTLIVGGLVARRCFEIGFIPVNPRTGNSCISFCNLTEINGGACNTEKKFYEACESAAIVGTLQASYTSMPFLGDDTEELIKHEALIGVSITGIMDNPKILLNPEILRKGAEIVNKTNEIVAEIIGINPAARTTCVKPSGNASVLLETSSGIHAAHSKKYFRIMQMNKSTEMSKVLEENNPTLLENSVWSATGKDWAVYIPIEEKDGCITKDDITDVEFAAYIKTVYQNWVLPGTRTERGYSNRITHNVSNTITVSDWDGVFDFIYENKENFCGLSMLPATGDKIFKQAPFTKVLDFNELVAEYGDGVIFASGLIIDALHSFNDDLWDACEAVKNKDYPLNGDRFAVLLKKDIVRRIKKFSKNYFKNNINTTISCLKDVHLFHKWKVIQRDFKTIDFELLDLKPSYTSVSEMGGVACSAGACEITYI